MVSTSNLHRVPAWTILNSMVAPAAPALRSPCPWGFWRQIEGKNSSATCILPSSFFPSTAWCPEFPREMHFRRLEGVGKDGSTSSCQQRSGASGDPDYWTKRSKKKLDNKNAVSMWQSWSESLALAKCLQSGDVTLWTVVLKTLLQTYRSVILLAGW